MVVNSSLVDEVALLLPMVLPIVDVAVASDVMRIVEFNRVVEVTSPPEVRASLAITAPFKAPLAVDPTSPTVTVVPTWTVTVVGFSTTVDPTSSVE